MRTDTADRRKNERRLQKLRTQMRVQTHKRF